MKPWKLVIMLVVLALLGGITGCAGTTTTAPTTTAMAETTTSTATTTAITPTTTEPTPTTTVPPTPTVTTGSLEIHSNAWNANVFIDGEPKGKTGIGDININGLLPGTYTVKITSDIYSDFSKQVAIETGKTTVIYANLATPGNGSPSRNEIINPDSAALYGSLEIHSNAWAADTYVGGEPGGQTGIGDITIDGLLPGTYTVGLTSDVYSAWSKQVIIETGKTTVLYANMATEGNGAPSRNEIINPDSAALYGSLEIHTNAWNADTYVGSEPGGQTGIGEVTIDGLLPGTYTVKLTSPVYRDWIGQVTITTGQTTVITAEMVQN